MNLPRASREIDELAKIESARLEWLKAINAISNTGSGFMGPHGVSSNVQFEDAAKKLFDDHVAHLIERRKAAIIAALDPSA